jgi:hypothetical protein
MVLEKYENEKKRGQQAQKPQQEKNTSSGQER